MDYNSYKNIIEDLEEKAEMKKLDPLAKKLEAAEYQRVNEKYRAYMMSGIFDDMLEKERPSNSRSRLKDLKEQLDIMNRECESLQRAVEFEDALPFKAGDVAIHKDHGNVLIREVLVNENDLEKSGYKVVSVKNTLTIPYKELLPMTEASKTLYGNKAK